MTEIVFLPVKLNERSNAVGPRIFIISVNGDSLIDDVEEISNTFKQTSHF